MATLSMALHAVLILLVLIASTRIDALPEPAVPTDRVFLVSPGPLPPPPPPPARAARRIAAIPEARPATFMPLSEPVEILPEASLAPEVDGVPGGLEGGVPGGVVGGVVGGTLGESTPPAPAVVRVGAGVKEPAKLKHVSPLYPDQALAGRIEGTVVLEATIAPSGKVAEVKVLRAPPALEQAAVAAVRQWVYTPTLLDGVPVTAIMTVTVRFQLS
jgi:protein TonB